MISMFLQVVREVKPLAESRAEFIKSTMGIGNQKVNPEALLKLHPESRHAVEQSEKYMELRKSVARMGRGLSEKQMEDIVSSILELTSGIPHPKLQKRLEILKSKLHKPQAAELMHCIEDVRQAWTRLLLDPYISRGVDAIIRRIGFYLKGGSDGRVSFAGIFSQYGNRKLAEQILADKDLKKLRTLRKEVAFFDMIAKELKLALTNEGWKGFYGEDGVYSNLRKGKKYIEKVRNEFGNEEFATLLEKFDDRVHEQPELWRKELQELDDTIKNPKFIRENVVYPAQRSLLRIFWNGLQEVQADRLEEKMMQDILEEIEGHLRDYRSHLEEEVMGILREFEDIDNEHAADVKAALEDILKIASELFQEPVRRSKRLQAVDKRELWWLASAARSLTGGKAFLGYYAGDQIAKASVIKESIANSPLDGNGVAVRIMRLRNTCTRIVIPHLGKVNAFLASHKTRLNLPAAKSRGDSIAPFPPSSLQFARAENQPVGRRKAA